MITRTYHRYRRVNPRWWQFWREPRLVLVEKRVQTLSGGKWKDAE